MSRENVKNLEDLIKHQIKDKKIVEVKTSRLTAPGENYGGLLLRLDITLESTVDKTVEEFPVVAKCIPVNTFMQKMFNIQEYQQEQGVKQVIDCFPQMYGARLNLNGSETVDEDSAIILENLVESGYKNVNRTIGFDLESTELILKNMAAFHAIPLAFKLSKPDLFTAKIEPHVKEVFPSSSPPPDPGDWFSELLEKEEELKEVVPKLKELLKFGRRGKEERRGRFFTVTHGDMWVNNIMVKFVDGRAVSSKFVDFQNCAMRSLTRDLIFLLFSSVQSEILERHFDALIKFYHDRFIENLVQLGCNPTDFSFDKFQEEIEAESKDLLGQIGIMTTFVVFAKEGGHATEEQPDKPPDFTNLENITPKAKERFIFVVRKYQEKGWL